MSDTPEQYRFKGRRADGTAGTGSTSLETIAELTERLFDEGWRELVVLQNDNVVGAIERSKGKRVWWAESMSHHG